MTDRAPDPFAVEELARRLAEAHETIDALRREKADLRVRLDRVVEERAREAEG